MSVPRDVCNRGHALAGLPYRKVFGRLAMFAIIGILAEQLCRKSFRRLAMFAIIGILAGRPCWKVFGRFAMFAIIGMHWQDSLAG